MLNFYLGEMSDLILKCNGTLDKYIGDAIMSFWNAPIIQSDHALLACRAALAMRDREAQIQDDLKRLGAPGLLTRIGINTGPMVFGNMGAPQKFNYSVLGDAVNLGSRLEGANKIYSSRILVAETTVALAREKFVFRELDLLRVKGKLKPLAVFELLAEGAAADTTRDRIGMAHGDVDRIVQLIQKTNQFNLTTRRHSKAYLLDRLKAQAELWAFRVRDVHGDHGIIAVVLLEFTGAACLIDTLLMSCRVIGRTIETAILSFCEQRALARGARRMNGEYLPTPKNSPCKDFYPAHGFSGPDESGARWSKLLGTSPSACPEWISLEAAAEYVCHPS